MFDLTGVFEVVVFKNDVGLTVVVDDDVGNVLFPNSCE